MDKIFMQILENQNHILFVLGQMSNSGRVSSGLYSRDKISDKLQKETFDLIKIIIGESDAKDKSL